MLVSDVFDSSTKIIVGYLTIHYFAMLRMECNGRKYCGCRRWTTICINTTCTIK